MQFSTHTPPVPPVALGGDGDGGGGEGLGGDGDGGGGEGDGGGGEGEGGGGEGEGDGNEQVAVISPQSVPPIALVVHAEFESKDASMATLLQLLREVVPENMAPIPVTLLTSKTSGWLKAEAW